MGVRTGGGGSTVIYRLSSNHAVIYSGLSGTGVAASVADAALHLGEFAPGADPEQIIIQTDLTFDDNGMPTLKVNQTKDDGALDSFIDMACPKKMAGGTTTTEQLVSETGKRIGGSIAGAQDLLVISHGAGDADDLVPAVVNIMNAKKSSGGFSWVNGQYVKPAMEMLGVALTTDLSIPAALFDDDVVTPVGAQSISKDYYSKTFRLPKA